MSARTLDPNLAFLLDEKEVPPEVQTKILDSGLSTLSRFLFTAESQEDWKKVFRSWDLDPDADPKNRLAMIMTIDAWDTAKVRIQEERRAEAEARQAGIPKPLGKLPHLQARRAVETRFQSLADRECPAALSVDKVITMIEERHCEILPLREVLSVEEVEEEQDPTITWGKDGSMKLRRKSQTVQEPRDPEQFRARTQLLGMSYAFAFARMPTRRWLETATPQTMTNYANYILGDRVRGLSAMGPGGDVVGRPSWAQVLAYEKQVRKKQAELVNSGLDFESALTGACKDAEVRELYLTTPTSISVAFEAVRGGGPPRERSPRRAQGRGQSRGAQGRGQNRQTDHRGGKGNSNNFSIFGGGGFGKGGGSSGWGAPSQLALTNSPWPQGGGQGAGGKGTKGKKGNKGGKGGKGGPPGKGSGLQGAQTGFGNKLRSETPDKRQICFNFNAAHGCDGSCGRVHVCRRCLNPGHGCHENKCPETGVSQV